MTTPKSLKLIINALVLAALVGLNCADQQESEPQGDPGGKADTAMKEKILVINIEALDLGSLRCDDDTSAKKISLTLNGNNLVATIKLHGATSCSYPKKSYALEFQEEDQPGYVPKGDNKQLEIAVFGSGKDKIDKLILNASFIDPTFMNNALIFDLARAMGGLAPRLTYANVSVGSRLIGLYQVIEGVDKQFFKHRDKLGKKSDYYMFKATNHAYWRPDEIKAIGSDGDGGAIYCNSTPCDTKAENAARVIFTSVGKVSTGEQTARDNALMSFLADAKSRMNDIVDQDNLRLFQILHTMGQNQDSFSKNYYLLLSKDSTQKARLISWDADATFGRYWNGCSGIKSVFPFGSGNADGNNEFIFSWFDNNATQYYRDFMFLLGLDGTQGKALGGLLGKENLLKRINSLQALLQDAATKDLEINKRFSSACPDIAPVANSSSNYSDVMNNFRKFFGDVYWEGVKNLIANDCANAVFGTKHGNCLNAQYCASPSSAVLDPVDWSKDNSEGNTTPSEYENWCSGDIDAGSDMRIVTAGATASLYSLPLGGEPAGTLSGGTHIKLVDERTAAPLVSDLHWYRKVQFIKPDITDVSAWETPQEAWIADTTSDDGKGVQSLSCGCDRDTCDNGVPINGFAFNASTKYQCIRPCGAAGAIDTSDAMWRTCSTDSCP